MAEVSVSVCLGASSNQISTLIPHQKDGSPPLEKRLQPSASPYSQPRRSSREGRRLGIHVHGLPSLVIGPRTRLRRRGEPSATAAGQRAFLGEERLGARITSAGDVSRG